MTLMKRWRERFPGSDLRCWSDSKAIRVTELSQTLSLAVRDIEPRCSTRHPAKTAYRANENHSDDSQGYGRSDFYHFECRSPHSYVNPTHLHDIS